MKYLGLLGNDTVYKEQLANNLFFKKIARNLLGNVANRRQTGKPTKMKGVYQCSKSYERILMIF